MVTASKGQLSFQFVISLVLILLFMSPFLLLLTSAPVITEFDWGEFSWALQNTLIQALGSTFLALTIGILLLKGSFYFNQLSHFLAFLCFVPSLLPSLFTLLIFLSYFNPFPMGIKGMILVHGVTYAGIATLSLFHLINERAYGFIQVCRIHGLSSFATFKQIILGFKFEILIFSLIIFMVCFTSFAIPVSIGGGRGTTLEVLIFENIRIHGNYSQALVISLFQSFFLFAFSFLPLAKFSTTSKKANNLNFLSDKMSLVILLLYFLFFFGGFFYFTIQGIGSLAQIERVGNEISRLTINSFLASLAIALISFFSLMLIAFLSAQKFLRSFLVWYVPPSTAIIGTILVLYSADSQFTQVIAYFFAFILLSFFSLYKMGFEQSLSSLDRLQMVARQMGGGSWQFFRKVSFPYLRGLGLRLSGICALWGLGDFALTKIVFTQDLFLAQMIDDLMMSYRIHAATTLMGAMIVLGAGIYLLFLGVAYVFDHRSEKKI